MSRKKVECSHCGKKVDKRGIQQHKFYKHGDSSVDYDPRPSSSPTKQDSSSSNEEDDDEDDDIDTLKADTPFCPSCHRTRHVYKTAEAKAKIAEFWTDELAHKVQSYDWVCLNIRDHSTHVEAFNEEDIDNEEEEGDKL